VFGLRFFVDPRSALPIYQQLVNQIKAAAAGGLYPPGQQLPSVRELAGQLAINPNTVAKAFRILEEQGVIERRRGLGTLIAQKPAVAKDLTSLRIKLQELLVEAYHLGVGPQELRQMFETALNNWNKGKEEQRGKGN